MVARATHLEKVGPQMGRGGLNWAAMIRSIFAVLFLIQNAFSAPTNKPALLPRGREFGGLQLQITDAGFGAPAEVSHAAELRDDRTTGFYFSYLARVQNAALGERLSDETVRLSGLFAPDGAPLRASASWLPKDVTRNDKGETVGGNGEKIVAHTRLYADVLPTWKSVRAEFEVRNLLAPPSDAGDDHSVRRFEAISLPPAGEKITEAAPKLEFVSERGTKIKLIKIERESRKGNPEKGHVRFLWHVDAPANATNYAVEMANGRVVYDVPDKAEGAYSNKKYTDSTDIEIEALNAPLEAKSATLSFDLVEAARGWRKKSAFSLVSFEIPVAEIWKAAPLPIQTPIVAPVSAKNADFEAIWESLGDMSASWLQNHSRLWMRDLTPEAALGAWTPKSVEIQNGGKTETLSDWYSIRDGVFHADNAIRRAGEVGYSLRYGALGRSENPPAALTADLTIKAQRARTFLHSHSLRNVPLPAINTMREFGPNEFDDGVWKLRRVIWAESEEFKKLLGNSESWLILTFERDPETAFEADNMMLTESVFYDEKGVFDPGTTTFADGDFIDKNSEKTRISLLISPPASEATHFSANFQVQQQVWSGPVQTLIVPAVPLVAASKPEAKTN